MTEQQAPQERTETLVLLGNGPTWEAGVKIAQQNGFECWGINYMNQSISHLITMCFQMHGPHFVNARFAEHYLKYPFKCPVVMHSPDPRFPTAIPWPMKDCQAFFKMPRPYFACTMSYVLALAIMTNRYKKIFIYGVDFYYELKHEFAYERPNFEWYMGYATALGIEIDIPEDSRLMTTSDNHRQVYGLEWNPILNPDEVAVAGQLGAKRLTSGK